MSTAAKPAPIFAIARHRMNLDGVGIVTLVTFCGCPLRCRYCLNPQSFDPKTKAMLLTPQELYDRVKVDNLYFLASGGGVTFGGGEPLLYPQFLREFRSLCPDGWRLGVETSLNVPWEAVETAAFCIDHFFIDGKDSNPAIYRAYTGQDNGRMLDNLKRLAALIPPERITVRIPLIPDYNTDEDRDNSQTLYESYGLTQFDRFTYKIREHE